MLVEQLLNTPGYAPNEPELQPETLKAEVADLRKKNSAVVAARSVLKDKRSRRDEILYKKGTGLVDVALEAKAYIRGAFGPSSSQFKKVQGLEFRKN